MEIAIVYNNHRGRNFFKWLWECTNLNMPVFVGNDDKTIQKALDCANDVRLKAGIYDLRI